MIPKILSVTPGYKGWGSYLVATISLGDGQQMKREIEHHGNGAAILPYDPVRRKALLVRQFRAPLAHVGADPLSLEVIAGIVEEDDPLDTARREAMEEAGVRIRAPEPVASPWSMPGISTERMHLFLGEYHEADRISEGGGLAEEHERIEVLEYDLAVLGTMADRGEINDMKAFALLQTLRLRKPELFC